MPATKTNQPIPTEKESNKEVEIFKGKVGEIFNERYQKLNQASANATNVWDRLTLEYRIKELTDLYTLIKEL